MGLSLGIIGLPNVGKSTLFNAITAAQADAANYPFCTIDPNLGIVSVPDRRLERLQEIYQPQKKVPTSIEFVDIAGLVKGASKGEGLGNQFLSHIRNVDALVHVVRCFDDPNVVHVDGSVDPTRDIEIIEAELLFKDLESLEKRMAETERRTTSGDKKAAAEMELYERTRHHIHSNRLMRYFQAQNEEETDLLRGLHFLTNKPVMYVCNVSENQLHKENDHVRQVRTIADKEGATVTILCAGVEAELSRLNAADQQVFLHDFGLTEPGLFTVIREGYALLHLITFFTTGPKEVRAWTIEQGTRAAQAAGSIHSDFERGFIRAEIMSFGDLDRYGTESAVRENGELRIEGRDYVMQDGDIVFFRFNV